MEAKKIITVRILLYFIVSFLILCQAVMWKYVGFNIHGNLYKYIIVLLCGCILLVLNRFKKEDIIIGIAFFFYFCVFFLFNPESIKSVMLAIVIPFIAMTLVFREMKDSKILKYLFEAYSNVVFFISAVSLFFWIFGSLLHLSPGRMYVSYEWAEHVRDSFTYFYIYFENPVQNMNILGSSIVRNTGLFTEAPGYCSVLTYAILLEVFYFRKRLFRILLLSLTILSVFSTKGFALLLIIFIYYYLKMIKNTVSYSMKTIMLVLIPLAFIIVCFIAFAVMSHKSGTGSFAIRMDDLKAGLTAWKSNLLFGAGYADSCLTRYFNVKRDNDGLSMGLTTTLGKGGLYLVSFYIYPMIKVLTEAKNNNRLFDWFFIVFIILFEFFISNVGATTLFIAVIALLYACCFSSSEKESVRITGLNI